VQIGGCATGSNFNFFIMVANLYLSKKYPITSISAAHSIIITSIISLNFINVLVYPRLAYGWWSKNFWQALPVNLERGK